jgi:hypothetical protein
MKEQCVISVGSRDHYVLCIDRLARSLHPWTEHTDVLLWKWQYPEGSPPHSEFQHRYKCFAFQAAVAAGYRRILWCDSVVQAVQHPQPVFDLIARDGFFMRNTGNPCGAWTSDRCLEIMGLSRDEAMGIPEGSGACFGVDVGNPVGKRWLDEWCHYAALGAFNGPWDNQGNKCSTDPRCRGHRHDQSVGSILANRLGLKLDESHLFQPAPDGWPYGEVDVHPEARLIHGGTNWWEWNHDVMSRCPRAPAAVANYWQFPDPLSCHSQKGLTPIEWQAARKHPSQKLKLPTVTLLCADGYSPSRVARVLEVCTGMIDFGAVKLLTHQATDSPYAVKIQPLISHLDYSLFMLFEAHRYVDTEHAMIVQYDGWPLNPDAWDPEWLNYDYIAPLFLQHQQVHARSVGSGGFSLRSKRLMSLAASAAKARFPSWDGTPQSTRMVQPAVGCYEDGWLAVKMRPELEAAGCRYAPPREASRFAWGGNLSCDYYVERPFGFHGIWLNYIDFSTGRVSPPGPDHATPGTY